MTRGERLKTLLGLDKYRYVVFERILEFPVMAITIYYDSHRPNLPLTNDLLHRKFHFFSARKPPYTKNLPVTPIMALEYYNAGADPSLIFIVDVGGDLTDPKDQIPRRLESTEIYKPRLDEWVTLRALQNPASVDAFTRGFQTIRRKAVGGENITAKPLNVFYDEKRDFMRFTFVTTATVPVYPPQTQFKKTDPNQNFALKRNPDKQYHIQIQILEFMKWLKETRPDEMADQPITRQEIKDVLDVAYVQVWCSCLRGNTPIKLLDGRTLPIKDVVEEIQSGKELWVYSTDEHGNFKPGKILAGAVTGTTTEFIRVTLDNGKIIETTPDHLFMKRTGEYEEAQNLKVGDSLMPLYFRDTDNGYEMVKHNYGDYGYHSVYKEVVNATVSEEVFEEVRKNDPQNATAIHHIDYNKRNNNPSNLRVMGHLEHYKLHSQLITDRRKNDPEFIRKLHEANVKHIQELNANPTEAMKKASEANLQKGREWVRENKELHGELTSKGLQKFFKEHPEACEKRSEQTKKFYQTEAGKEKAKSFSDYVKNKWASEEGRADYMSKHWSPFTYNKEYGEKGLAKVRENWESLSPEEKKLRMKNTVSKKYKRLIQEMEKEGLSITWDNMKNFKCKHTRKLSKHFSSFEDLLEFLGYKNYNHKVASIERIIVPEEDVYDISIENWENFYVDAGVIVHNCPAFHWQASNYNLSQLDGSIHPTDIAPHYWNQPHLHGDGENFLCKHLAGFVNQIDFFLNPMAAMATKILKNKGLI